jgi:D-alanyl-lipoteichoic acid acyltransferase DltB (MBOAT superfamily)/lysophospholipase L1-like esterase
MRLFFYNVYEELRRIVSSPSGFMFLVLQSLLVGFTLYTAMGSYSGLNTPLEDGMVPVPGLEPLRDFFVPLFRNSYLYLWLVLPIVFSSIIPGPNKEVKYNFIGQFFGIGRTLYAKMMAGLLFYLALLTLSLPAVYYWIMLGGDIFPGEMVLLYGGYFLYGLFILSLTFFTSSLLKNRFAASFIAISITVALLGYDLWAEFSPAKCSPAPWTLPSVMSFFETGNLFIPAMAYFVVPVTLFLLVATILPMIRSRKKSVLLSATLLLGLCALIGTAAAFNKGLAGTGIDLTEHEHATAVSWVYVNVEGQMVPYGAYRGADTGAGTVTPELQGHPLVISDTNRKDILVVYWGMIPFILLFFMAVRAVRKSGIPRAGKRAIVAPATWLVIMASLAMVQDFYVKNRDWKVFPSIREILPRWAVTLGEKISSTPAVNAEAKNGGKKADSPAQTGDQNFIYAGKEYKNLQRFFKKLADLQARRRNSVHIMHYGDSLIWGDCYSKTLKRSFQKDFGDGGRGVVPPVETMATALQDHVNRTPPGGFRQHAIRHEFRYLGKFYIRPEVNSLFGFTGEGTFVRSPMTEIRMETPAGSEKWKRVKVFLRSPVDARAGISECRLNLDYGTGSEQKVVRLSPGGTGSVTWDVPGTDRIRIDFAGSTGTLPSVDAVDVESGRGVVYSTIVRMGIHMAWMNAVPEQNLKSLAEIQPDLLIFQFGINEAASLGAFPEFTREELRSQMREWLMKVKRLLPETDILLIGPPERLQNYQSGLATMKETLAVREVQREEAERAGLAYFDTYDSLGGEGHMMKMVNSGLAMKDYTHFTMRGGDTAAQAFYTSLMNAYHKKNQRPKLDFKIEEKTAILFNSASFAYFLGTVIIIAFLLRRWPSLRFGFLLAASYYFYATWKLWPLACLVATTVTDYSMALCIKAARDRGGRGTAYLVVSLAVNLGILFTLKYFDFFSDLTGKAINALGYQSSVPILNILLPVGISFYTFQSLSYTIDIWRGNLEPEKNIVRYAHYVSLFTQLLAGPIVKAREFLPALREKASHFLVTHEHVSTALFLILAGLVKKAGADWLAGSIVDRVYASPHMFLPLETLTAVYAYGLQIYGDFSGYSDIAIGSAMLLGYNLTENFRRPYASASVSEFWQRWHISLGSWLRDYLYISLGGNRKRVLFNIGITMFLCGLWHGAAIPFVIWGAYHGLFMIAERVLKLNSKKSVNPFLHGLKVFFTLHAVLFGWIIFRSDSWETFAGIMNSLFRMKAGAPNVGVFLVLVMVGFYTLHYTPLRWKESLRSAWGRMPATVQGLAASCVTLFIYNIAIAEVKPFIYFQF